MNLADIRQRQALTAILGGIHFSTHEGICGHCEVDDLVAAVDVLQGLPGYVNHIPTDTPDGQPLIEAWGRNVLGEWEVQICEGPRYWRDELGYKFRRVRVDNLARIPFLAWLKTNSAGDFVDLVDDSGVALGLRGASYTFEPVTLAPRWLRYAA